jgi:hypothetical protein
MFSKESQSNRNHLYQMIKTKFEPIDIFIFFEYPVSQFLCGF